MWISIQELNEMGEYTAVELHQAKDVNTGGIFQLRQVHIFSLSSYSCLNWFLVLFLVSLCFFLLSLFLSVSQLPFQGHSRRVQVTVKPVQHSGTLPLMVEAILSVSIGGVTARSTKLQRGLDSYQVRQLIFHTLVWFGFCCLEPAQHNSKRDLSTLVHMLFCSFTRLRLIHIMGAYGAKSASLLLIIQYITDKVPGVVFQYI